MPIEFACDCGKQFRVSEDYAGKRTKCPACGIALTVPAAPEPEAVTEEDAAFLALSEGPDPAPSSRDWREPNLSAPVPSPRTANVPKAPPPPPPKKKPKKRAVVDLYASRERQWNVDWGRVAGGGLGVLLGGGLLIGGLAAGRLFLWSPIIIMGGLFAIIGGLLHKE